MMEEHAAEWVALERIKPWAKNPRINKDAIKSVADSIKRFGFGAPIVARLADGEIIAGHTRYAAAKQLGLERVPVRFLDLDPADAHLLAMADNKLGEIAEWNDRELAELLSAYSLEDAGLAGWDSDALEELGSSLLGDGPEPEDPPDAATERIDELLRKWKVERGQVWTLGRHRLMCGDSTKREDVERSIDGRCDVMFTSPPYALGKSSSLSGNGSTRQRGNAYDLHDDNAADWPALMRGFVEASRGSVNCMAINVQPLAGNKRALMSWAAENAEFLVDVMVWNKGHAAPQMAAGVLTSSFELVFVFAESNASRSIPYSSWRGNVSAVVDIPPQRNNDFAKEHSATMPVALAAHFVGVVFDTCKTVYEPFSGTGTTIIACEHLGKKCCAIEISPGYVALALERMSLMGVDVKLA